MAERYVVIPAWATAGLRVHASGEAAAVDAANQVEKDRAPRVVVKLHSEVHLAKTPRVDIVQIAGFGDA
ncbi:hypothetical protein [Luteimonas terricola]|uniref:Uncharacterized protein n=1 Tax=Luteimonas terricola TaxID=645597 RepID=A0ABQ2EHH8_9GAMM|nr:hypothetical protein [Luteimonas terricola]GGK08781.1 hypothetical protein GCM10011394_17790 [Luteimonas terricola]